MRNPDFQAIKTLDPNALFSITEAATMLGMTHNGIRAWIQKDKIKYGKTGGRYCIPGSEIQKQVKLPDETDL